MDYFDYLMFAIWLVCGSILFGAVLWELYEDLRK